MNQLNKKDEIRWELAHVSNNLNQLLKSACRRGPVFNHDLQKIQDLRDRRDELLNQVYNL